MKHLKLFEGFLLENMDIDGIYQKYYSDIPYEDYVKIVEADPTYKGKRTKGLYMKWLLELYRNNKLLIEDLYKVTNYLSVYHQYQRQIGKSLDGVNSLVELLSLVEPFMEKEDSVFTNDEERQLAGQFEQVYKDDKWRIVIPLTLDASKYFGKGTQWCTTNTNQFEHYTRNQTKGNITIYNLYILIPIDGNMNKRLQFHFFENQFMDVKDEDINLTLFFDSNTDIFNFFDKYFPVLRYSNLYEFYMKGERLSENEKDAITFTGSLVRVLKKSKKYKEKNNNIYFIDVNDNNKIYMEIANFPHPKLKNDMSCRWKGFWEVLENKYLLPNKEIRAIIKTQLEKYFGLGYLRPMPVREYNYLEVWDNLSKYQIWEFFS